MVTLVCFCGEEYEVREADIKRGWGKTCSKSCAAVKREYGRPDPKTLSGKSIKFGKKYKRPNPPNDSRMVGREYYDLNDDPSWDSHKGYFMYP